MATVITNITIKDGSKADANIKDSQLLGQGELEEMEIIMIMMIHMVKWGNVKIIGS